ncbi:MAG: SM-20-related protein [Francisella sp.]|jgi:SM-20-related protein
MSNLLPINASYEKIIEDYDTNGYCIIDNWLIEDETNILFNELSELYDADCFRKAAIGNRLNETIERSIRSDFICWIDESKYAKSFFDKISDFIEYLNKTCFAGIVAKEFHYAVYPKRSFYKKHLDTFQNDDKRTISIAFYLNESWDISYGGELKIYLKNQTLTILPTFGRIVLFDSKTIEHEVMPVLSNRKRFSITGWLKTH